VGLGASIAVLNLSGQVRAKAGGDLEAGGAVRVEAHFDQDVDVTSFAMQAGFVGLGAAVVVVTDTSAQQARLLDGTILNGASSVTIMAVNDQRIEVKTFGAQAGAVGAGASFTDVSIGNSDAGTVETLARVGANSQIGQVSAIGAITVSADSTIDATATTIAIAAGIGAFSFNFAFVDVTPDVQASIGAGTSLTGNGLATIEAITDHKGRGDLFALSIGALAAGVSLTTVEVSPRLSALIDNNATISTNGVTLLTSHNYADNGTPLNQGAVAEAEASGGGIVSGQGAVPTPCSTPMSARAAV
jgi:hypothetical protein